MMMMMMMMSYPTERRTIFMHCDIGSGRSVDNNLVCLYRCHFRRRYEVSSRRSVGKIGNATQTYSKHSVSDATARRQRRRLHQLSRQRRVRVSRHVWRVSVMCIYILLFVGG